MFGEWLIKGRQIKACCEKLADPRSCSMYIRAHNPINILKQNLMLVLLRRDHLVFDHQFGDEILALSVACLLVKESSICIFIL